MTKDYVLALLRQNSGYLSGSQISSMIGVSRMAVSTAVKALRSEGYIISAVTNRGYRLEHAPNRISPGELMPYLKEERMKNIHCLHSVHSTNQYLKNLANSGAPEKTVVIAEEQTHGKGRHGRSFFSPWEKGIYLSFLLRPQSTPADTTAMTAWAAVAIQRAIRIACGIETEIKWVNDLLLNGKKCCGILTEMSIESESACVEYAIIGVGINVSEDMSEFDEELRSIATSLKLETDIEYSRAQLAAQVIEELDQLCSDWPVEKTNYQTEYCMHNKTVGQNISVYRGNGIRRGKAMAINPDFSLRIQWEDGEIEDLISGEIKIESEM